MHADKKQLLDFIVNELAKVKSELEALRFLEEETGKSYRKEIDHLLDRKNELEQLYQKLFNQ